MGHSFVIGNSSFVISISVSNRDRNYLLGRGQTGEDFAHPIFTQGPHAEFARALTQDHSGRTIVHHVAHFVIDLKDLENSHATLVTGLSATLAADRPHDCRLA